MTLEIRERRTLKDGVYESLREALMTGEYRPGDRLTVRGVAERLGTSAMPVREAFRRLVSEGAIEPLLSGALRVPVLDAEKLRALTEIRLAVEGLAARRAASRMSSRDVLQLKHLNDEVIAAVRARTPEAEARANELFHFCLYRAAASPDLLRIIENLWLQVGPALVALLHERESNPAYTERRYLKHHKELIAAVQERDGAAAEEAICADLREGEATIMKVMKAAKMEAAPVARKRRRG